MAGLSGVGDRNRPRRGWPREHGRKNSDAGKPEPHMDQMDHGIPIEGEKSIWPQPCKCRAAADLALGGPEPGWGL